MIPFPASQAVAAVRVAAAVIVAILLTAVAGVNHAAAATLHDRSLALLRQRLSHPPATGDFTFVVLGDSRGNDPVFRKALSLALQQKPLFILHTGDFSGRGTEPEIRHFFDVVEQGAREVPLFVVIGNHENRPLYEKWIGPPELAFDLPGLASRVIIGDNAGYRLGASQLEWLRRQLLDSPKHTFVSYHIPPQTGRWRRHSFAEGSGEMIRLLAASRVSRAFFGHIHVFDEDTVTGVHYVVTGGAGAPLYAWAPGVAAHHIVVVKVEKGTVTHRMVPVEQ